MASRPLPDLEMPSGLKCLVRFKVNAAQAKKKLERGTPVNARN